MRLLGKVLEEIPHHVVVERSRREAVADGLQELDREELDLERLEVLSDIAVPLPALEYPDEFPRRARRRDVRCLNRCDLGLRVDLLVSSGPLRVADPVPAVLQQERWHHFDSVSVREL